MNSVIPEPQSSQTPHHDDAEASEDKPKAEPGAKEVSSAQRRGPGSAHAEKPPLASAGQDKSSSGTEIEPQAGFALVVDDEPANRDFLVRLLEQAELKVRGASTGAEALAIADELGEKLRLVMLDYQLPDQKGVELLRSLNAKLPKAKIMMATMHDERSIIREAFEGGCAAFLVKPHGFMQLLQMLQKMSDDPAGMDGLDGLIFDMYGSRPWRGG